MGHWVELEATLTPLGQNGLRLLEMRERLGGAGAALATREREIMRLVAGGHENKQVAAMLSLSKRTVDNHLRAVYRKLGVTNRTAAAAAVRGLT